MWAPRGGGLTTCDPSTAGLRQSPWVGPIWNTSLKLLKELSQSLVCVCPRPGPTSLCPARNDRFPDTHCRRRSFGNYIGNPETTSPDDFNIFRLILGAEFIPIFHTPWAVFPFVSNGGRSWDGGCTAEGGFHFYKGGRLEGFIRATKAPGRVVTLPADLKGFRLRWVPATPDHPSLKPQTEAHRPPLSAQGPRVPLYMVAREQDSLLPRLFSMLHYKTTFESAANVTGPDCPACP